MCYGHTISSPLLTLRTNTTLSVALSLSLSLWSKGWSHYEPVSAIAVDFHNFPDIPDAQFRI